MQRSRFSMTRVLVVAMIAAVACTGCIVFIGKRLPRDDETLVKRHVQQVSLRGLPA